MNQLSNDEFSWGREKMTGRKGFTLIEVLVAVVIMSILSAIAYPQLRNWVRRAGFRSEVSQLVGYLHRAKMEAIKTNSFVVIDPDPNGYTIFVDNSSGPHEAGDWIRQEGEQLLVNCRLKDGITLANNFIKKKLRFSSQPGISAGKFTLKDIFGNEMDVIVNTVGRIRVK
jgi:prepilin-type N-terminal cleavage/methylation domain-containing protein